MTKPRNKRAFPEIGPAEEEELPEPTKVVGGGPMPWTPKRTQMPSLDFPPNYPNHLKLRTESIIREALKKSKNETVILKLCQNVISKLTPLFYAEVTKGMESSLAKELIMSPTIQILNHNCDRYALQDLRQKLEESDAVGKMIKELIQAVPKTQRTEVTDQSSEAAEAHEQPEMNTSNDGSAQPKIHQDRKAQVNAYLETVFKATGKRITRTDIWKSARYKDGTEFERWQRHDPRTTKAGEHRFERILREKPHLK